MSANQISLTKDTELWKEVAEITSRIQAATLSAEPPTPHIVINPSIKPVLPSEQQTIARFSALQQPSAFRAAFLRSCAQLKTQAVQQYQIAARRLRSLYHITGRLDDDQQHELSNAIRDRYLVIEAVFFDLCHEHFHAQSVPSTVNISTNHPIRIPKESNSLLLTAYELNQTPSDRERELLAKACGMTYLQVTTWFQNKRQRMKANIRDPYNNPLKPSTTTTTPMKPQHPSNVQHLNGYRIPVSATGEGGNEREEQGEGRKVRGMPRVGRRGNPDSFGEDNNEQSDGDDIEYVDEQSNELESGPLAPEPGSGRNKKKSKSTKRANKRNNVPHNGSARAEAAKVEEEELTRRASGSSASENDENEGDALSFGWQNGNGISVFSPDHRVVGPNGQQQHGLTLPPPSALLPSSFGQVVGQGGYQFAAHLPQQQFGIDQFHRSLPVPPVLAAQAQQYQPQYQYSIPPHQQQFQQLPRPQLGAGIGIGRPTRSLPNSARKQPSINSVASTPTHTSTSTNPVKPSFPNPLKGLADAVALHQIPHHGHGHGQLAVPATPGNVSESGVRNISDASAASAAAAAERVPSGTRSFSNGSDGYEVAEDSVREEMDETPTGKGKKGKNGKKGKGKGKGKNISLTSTPLSSTHQNLQSTPTDSTPRAPRPLSILTPVPQPPHTTAATTNINPNLPAVFHPPSSTYKLMSDSEGNQFLVPVQAVVPVEVEEGGAVKVKVEEGVTPPPVEGGVGVGVGLQGDDGEVIEIREGEDQEVEYNGNVHGHIQPETQSSGYPIPIQYAPALPLALPLPPTGLTPFDFNFDLSQFLPPSAGIGYQAHAHGHSDAPQLNPNPNPSPAIRGQGEMMLYGNGSEDGSPAGSGMSTVEGQTPGTGTGTGTHTQPGSNARSHVSLPNTTSNSNGADITGTTNTTPENLDYTTSFPGFEFAEFGTFSNSSSSVNNTGDGYSTIGSNSSGGSGPFSGDVAGAGVGVSGGGDGTGTGPGLGGIDESMLKQMEALLEMDNAALASSNGHTGTGSTGSSPEGSMGSGQSQAVTIPVMVPVVGTGSGSAGEVLGSAGSNGSGSGVMVLTPTTAHAHAQAQAQGTGMGQQYVQVGAGGYVVQQQQHQAPQSQQQQQHQLGHGRSLSTTTAGSNVNASPHHLPAQAVHPVSVQRSTSHSQGGTPVTGYAVPVQVTVQAQPQQQQQVVYGSPAYSQASVQVQAQSQQGYYTLPVPLNSQPQVQVASQGYVVQEVQGQYKQSPVQVQAQAVQQQQQQQYIAVPTPPQAHSQPQPQQPQQQYYSTHTHTPSHTHVPAQPTYQPYTPSTLSYAYTQPVSSHGHGMAMGYAYPESSERGVGPGPAVTAVAVDAGMVGIGGGVGVVKSGGGGGGGVMGWVG